MRKCDKDGHPKVSVIPPPAPKWETDTTNKQRSVFTSRTRVDIKRGTETDCCAWAWKESTSILLSDKKLAIK